MDGVSSSNRSPHYTIKLLQRDLDRLHELAEEENVTPHSIALAALRNRIGTTSPRSAKGTFTQVDCERHQE